MVDRAKEILRLKARVRKLEDKCRSVLSVPRCREEAAGKTEEHRDETEAAPADAPAGDAPLMVLRRERDVKKTPTVLDKVKQHKLPDSVVMSTPSDLQQAQDVNHQLKVQFLNMQATLLKWAVQSKRLRDSTLKEAKQKKEKSKKQTVSDVRLRELLRLEAAVKGMFTESQIRAISREHSAARKGGSHWGEEDLRRVLELRAISSDRVLDHVRDKMKIPLPTMAGREAALQEIPRNSAGPTRRSWRAVRSASLTVPSTPIRCVPPSTRWSR